MLLTTRMASAAGAAITEAVVCSTAVIASSDSPLPACGEREKRETAEHQLDLSQGSLRFGHPALAPTYSFDALSISGLTFSLIGEIQSDTLVHLVPSHSEMNAALWPLWSSQLTFIGEAKPSAPISFKRAAEISSVSSPRRRSVPLISFLPEMRCALRIASAMMMELRTPRL